MNTGTFGKALQRVSDFNSWALEAEDWLFLRRHYENALGGWMQANKLTPDTITPAQLTQAREYAINEAQKANEIQNSGRSCHDVWRTHG